MLLGGDELGRTQDGNNNGYCQDNETSWYHWPDADDGLLAFSRGMIEFRKTHRVFRRRTFFQGRPIHGTDVSDIAWFTPSGDEMEDQDWAEGLAKTLGVFLNGDALETGRRGEEYTDDSFLLLFNAHPEPVTFTLPSPRWGDEWELLTDTRSASVEQDQPALKPGDTVDVEGRSMAVLRRAHPS
jgi:glycogen operon protein